MGSFYPCMFLVHLTLSNCRIRVSALCRLAGRVELSNSDLSREIMNFRFVNRRIELKFLQQVLDHMMLYFDRCDLSIWKSIVREVFFFKKKGSLRLGCWQL